MSIKNALRVSNLMQNLKTIVSALEKEIKQKDLPKNNDSLLGQALTSKHSAGEAICRVCLSICNRSQIS